MAAMGLAAASETKERAAARNCMMGRAGRQDETGGETRKSDKLLRGKKIERWRKSEDDR